MNASTTQLGDLCSLVSSQVNPAAIPNAPYLGLERLEPGRLRVDDYGVASEVASLKMAFEPNDVLYGKLRPYLDKAVLADRQGVATTELLVLRPKPNVDPKYLACVVHSPSFIEFSMRGVTGVQHPRTSWSHIKEFELPHRELPEQITIARLLGSMSELRVAADRALCSASALKCASMQEVFTRGLRCEEQKETVIGPLPASWDVVPIGSLGKVGNGSTPKRANTAYWSGGTFPWLNSAKVYDRDILVGEQFVTETALRECHLPIVEPGAVLMAITGQGKTLGNVAVLRTRATISQHVAYIQVDQTQVVPGFLRGYLETQYDDLRQIASGGGSTKGALTCAFLRGLSIPLPPLTEQQEVVSVLEVLDEKIKVQRQKGDVLDELFKSLLHSLMTGEISVNDLDLSALPEIEGTAA